MSLTEVHHHREHEEGDEELFFGLYRGIVASVNDPQNRDRIRISIPQVHGDDASFWAEPCLPVAAWTEHTAHSDHEFTDLNDGTESTGDQSVSLTHDNNHTAHHKVPDVGMGVWVMFEAGDPEKPVWMGIWQKPKGGQ